MSLNASPAISRSTIFAALRPVRSATAIISALASAETGIRTVDATFAGGRRSFTFDCMRVVCHQFSRLQPEF